MISSLSGTVASMEASGIEVDVAGVGYFVHVPSSVASRAAAGKPIRLLTHLVVREDAMTLYGFLTREQKEAFSALIAVSGVGPKLALAVLSVFEPDDLRKLVASSDVEALCEVPGIGKRGAQRLVMELKDKLGVPLDRGAPFTSTNVQVREALLSLGYSAAEVREALDRLPEADAPVEDLVRSALRDLARV